MEKQAINVFRVHATRCIQSRYAASVYLEMLEERQTNTLDYQLETPEESSVMIFMLCDLQGDSGMHVEGRPLVLIAF